MLNLRKILVQILLVIVVTTNTVFASNLQGLRVILDSGHGGKDNGASGKTSDNKVYYEKNLNNSLTQKLATILSGYGAEVAFTRNPYEDKFWELSERTTFANQQKVDLFISIHHNSATSSTANGAEVFFSTNRPNISSKKYVELNGAKYDYVRESKEDGVDYVYILVEGQEKKIEKSKVKIVTSSVSWQAQESQRLANLVMSNLASLGLKNRGAKDSNLFVTRNTIMPSILIEPGFVSNPTELAKLADENFQMQLAQKIADAVCEYYSVYQSNKAKYFDGQVSVDITKRLQGDNRYKTNLAIVDEGWQKAENAILVYGENYADALSSAALSKKLNAPIFLTKGTLLEDDIKQKLSNLEVKRVYIVGGKSIISEDIEKALAEFNIEAIRISGDDRYKTAVEVAKYFDNPKEAFLVTGRGFADALSVSTVAAIKEMPILFVDNNRYQDALDFVKSRGIEKVYVIGGQTVISDEVALNFGNYKRIFGMDRYQTNAKIIEEFETVLDFSKIYISTGENYPDALSCAALSAKYNSPIILSGSGAKRVSKIREYLDYIQEIVAIGGEKMMPNSVALKVFN